MKRYLEGPCIERLQTLVDYGNGSLPRKDIPVVNVTHQAMSDGRDTLFCKVYGFYPKEITITWRKNEEKTFHGDVVPNSDGTFHTWISIQINSTEKSHYWCSVEHTPTLKKPLLIPWKWSGSDSHSMRFLFMGVSEPRQGLPEFMAMQFVDDQPFIYYDSSTKKALPRAQWMEKLEKKNPRYRGIWSYAIHNWEERFRMSLVEIQNYCNRNEGFHTWQLTGGCELSKDEKKWGYERYGYDGKDFIMFDKENLIWMAADEVAENIKKRWDADLKTNQDKKAYLEGACITWLQKYVEYGRESLLRKETPVVKVAHKADSDDRETFICQAFGFYPKEIDITWKKDGEIFEQTSSVEPAPNSDGTYHAWIIIEIDPEHRDCYQCHVEHPSLLEPLDLSLSEESGRSLQGSSTHYLSLFYTWLSEPNQGLPEFMVGQFVDGQLITYYDSSTKRVLARAQWMEKNDTQFWDLESKTMKSWEEKFRALFVRLQNVSNQSEGLHIWQGTLGCGLREDGKKRGYWRSGYDGRDFISFNTETITWTVADAVAEKMKGKWGSLLTMSSNMKRYLEGPCIERLLTLVACGNGSLLRKDRPVVKVTRKATVGGQETLFCQAYGFYPKGINITWRKDGEFWKQGKFSVNPNSDGTYQSRTNIQIDPKDRGRYLCSVEHASLPEPHLIPLEGPDATISVPATTHQVQRRVGVESVSTPDPTVVHPSLKDAPRCPISQCISHASLCNGVWYCSSGGDEQTFGSSPHSLRFFYMMGLIPGSA
ncbi:uncharacterized protein LOC128343841 [Hemicordylus capensis]|uniref:uncharacterized protein LOC128343841 n=1 Tax=Hemicordylus capensis TaxID=884348 RepID=UPI002302E5E8|nr:uncharacterized protein LOC128343841 [Hemicordylus capensis]